MANETTIAALSADVAEAVAAEYLLLLADRAYIGNLPTLHYAGSVNDRYSNVLSVAHAGLGGYTGLASTAESTAVANTVLGDGKTQITVAKFSKNHQPSDMIRMIMGGTFNPQALALDAAAAGAATLSDLIADVIDGFTATAGPGSGINLDIPSLLAGVGKMGTLNADLSKGVTGALHGQQWSDVLEDYATVGGVIPFTNGIGDLAVLRGGSYLGTWLGVEWHRSNRVVTANAGADRAGGLFAFGGVVWADGQYVVEDPANQMVIGRNVLFERTRLGTAGATNYTTHTSVGVAKALEAGVTIISDA